MKSWKRLKEEWGKKMKNLNVVTLEDCMTLYLYGYEAVICDGGLIGLEKVEVGSRGSFYFSYSIKSNKR